MRITCLLICCLAFAGCRGKPAVGVPVTRDLFNARFEHGVTSWKFAGDQFHGKVQPQRGVNGSACAVLSVAPRHQSDCFSQAVIPLKASEVEMSAYVRASGRIKARLRLECIDPDQFDSVKNYGQLAEASSQACPTNGEWNLLTTKIQIPEGTKHIRAFGCVNGTDGVARFDDFSIVRR